MDTKENARFWVYVNDGWVKITLRPIQTLSHHSFCRDDEGAAWHSDTWHHTGAAVTWQFLDGGTDCDGRTERTGALAADISDLEELDPLAPETFRRPFWQGSEDVEIEDSFAQAANY
jgi:hypothetical protein